MSETVSPLAVRSTRLAGLLEPEYIESVLSLYDILEDGEGAYPVAQSLNIALRQLLAIHEVLYPSVQSRDRCRLRGR